MAEVGVLNLEVNANTGPAEEKLVKLGDALKRVKEAVSGGLKLSGVARQVKSIADAVNDNISDSTISKIGRLADELSKLKGFENVRINIKVNNAISGAIEELETGYEQVQEYNDKLEQVGATVSSAKDSVDNFAASVTRANEVIQNMSMQNDGWMAWFDLFKQKLNDFLRMRSTMALGAGPETGLATSWKNGAIEAEGTVTDACEVIEGAVSGTCESINNNLEGTRQVLLESGENGMRVFSSLEEAATYFGVSIDDIKRKLQETHDTVYGQKNQMNVFTSMEDAARALGITVDEVKQKLQETYDRIYGVQKAAPTPEISNAVTAAADKAISNSSTAASNAVNRVKDSVDSLIRNTSKVSLLTKELETLKGKLQQTIDMGGTQEEIDRVLKKILQVKEALKKEKVGGGLFTDLKNTIKNIFPMIADLLHRLKNAAIRRAMNTILRGLWSGLKEGVQNVYEYSKAIGSSFAPAMDSAASSILQMKNSLGAAVAPLIQSIIPYLQIVVKWFIDAVNWANQFISLMRGQSTWTRAVPATATAFGKQEKAAKGAAAAVKDLLADWDELNIIQSETNGAGSGAGTSAAEDYLNMFEEVGTFDNGVRKVVDYIKDNFDDILKIAELVGAAVAAWKVSNAFVGILATLASFVAGGALIGIEWNISTLLNDQYLKTGDIGWLVADVLKTLVGGVLMKRILGTVLKGEYAYLGIPIMLTVNAAARTVAVLSDPNVSALSQEALVANLTSALEGGAVAGYLMKSAGFATKTAIGGGAAATLVTFGVLTGLKADVEAVRSGEINDEYIKGKALEALSLGLGTAMIAKLLVPNVSTGQALGFGAATGISAVLITMGATLGIQATVKSIKSGETGQTFIQKALSSLSMGIGGALMGKMFLGSMLSSASAFGAGVALVTLSATIGISAVAKAVKSNETMEKIKATALTSLVMGAGTGVLAAALGGSAIATALAGAGITAGVLAIFFAVEASIRKKDVKWGTISLSNADVQKFVSEKMFTADIKTTMNLIDTVVTATNEEKENIKAQAAGLLTNTNIVKLGIATEATYLEMQKQLFGESLDGNGGLIKQIKDYAEEQKTLIKTSFTLVPIVDKTGNVDEAATAEILKAGLSGWSEVEGYMTTIGQQLSEALKVGATDGLDGLDDKLILKLTTELNNVQHALTSAKTSSGMVGSLMSGLQDMDQPTAKAIMELYKEQQKELEEKFNETLTEELASYNSLAAFYRARGNKGDETKAEQYETMAKTLVLDWADRLKASVKEAAGPGRQIIAEALLDLVSITPQDINGKLHNAGDTQYLFASIVEQIFTNQDISSGSENARQLKSLLYNYLLKVLENTLTKEDFEYVTYAISNGIVGFGDLFEKETIDSIKEEFMKNSDYGNLIATLLDELWAKSKSGEKDQHTTEVEHETIVNETIRREIEDTSTGMEEDPAIVEAQEIANGIGEAAATVNTITLDDLTFDTTGAVDAAGNAASAIEDMARRIRTAFESLNGMSFSFNAGDQVLSGIIATVIPSIEQKASGGFVKSGDLVMANENGNFEMMGKMGNQPVVANNQQIVNGISNGVAQANSGVESRLTTIERLLQRLLQKDFVARAVPDSRWGTHNAKSDAALERVIG